MMELKKGHLFKGQRVYLRGSISIIKTSQSPYYKEGLVKIAEVDIDGDCSPHMCDVVLDSLVHPYIEQEEQAVNQYKDGLINFEEFINNALIPVVSSESYYIIRDAFLANGNSRKEIQKNYLEALRSLRECTENEFSSGPLFYDIDKEIDNTLKDLGILKNFKTFDIHSEMEVRCPHCDLAYFMELTEIINTITTECVHCKVYINIPDTMRKEASDHIGG